MSSITGRLRDMELELSSISSGRNFVMLANDCRAGTRVKRYHTVDTLVGETVGHHSSNVALLCYLLTDREPSANLLIAALTHDLAERGTGDMPATAKWENPDLKAALDKAETKYELFPNKPALTGLEYRILKQADMLDLCFKSLEEIRMGNEQFRPIFQRGIGWLVRNDPLPITTQIYKELQHECK